MGDIWLDEYRADAVRTRPNRRASRGDRGSVRGWFGVVLAHNFCIESKISSSVRGAFHLRELSDIGIRIS